MKLRSGIRSSFPLAVLICFALTAFPSAAANKVDSPGFVDASRYTDLVDDECLRLQVWIPASLVRALSKVDPDLYQLVKGVEAIQAVILDVDCGKLEGVREIVREQEAALREAGWERLVLVREKDAEIRVLVLNNEERIDGLVVFVHDRDEGELVFVNIAGTVDLAAIQRIAEGFDIPGLKDIEAP